MAENTHNSRKKTKRIQNKVRVKLPEIESYEKTLEFTAEGPGRVVVRLERLMGSDRIRITDPKYLATLMERLEAEESQSWGSRSRLRKKAERNRSRQLAIEGLMEPTEDMQDLYEHPVFRVNRILNRLSVFDQTMSSPGATDKVPPIVPVEPFSEDLSGEVFKAYPHHQVFAKDDDAKPLDDDLKRQSSKEQKNKQSSVSQSKMDQSKSERKSGEKTTSGKSTKYIYKADDSKSMDTSLKPSESGLAKQSSTKVVKKDGDEEKEGEEKKTKPKKKQQEEEEEEDEEDKEKRTSGSEKVESLDDFRLQYGVPSDANLIRDWQEFTSHLVERVSEETGGSTEELLTLANEVIGTYDRQMVTVDEYVTELREEKVKEQRRAMGIPSDPDLVEREEEDEIEDEIEGDDQEEEIDLEEEELEDTAVPPLVGEEHEVEE